MLDEEGLVHMTTQQTVRRDYADDQDQAWVTQILPYSDWRWRLRGRWSAVVLL